MAEEAEQPQEQTAPDTDTGTQTESSDVDLREAITSLSSRFDDFVNTQQQSQQLESEGSLAEWLAGLEDEDVEQPAADAEAYQQEQPDQQDVDPRVLAELEGIKNYLVQQDNDKLVGEVNQLEEIYPDIREHLPQIANALDPIADRLGENVMLYRPLVEMAYKTVKADAASAQETTAEEGRNRGASLETDAGAGERQGEESYESQAAREIAQAGGPESIFF